MHINLGVKPIEFLNEKWQKIGFINKDGICFEGKESILTVNANGDTSLKIKKGYTSSIDSEGNIIIVEDSPR